MNLYQNSKKSKTVDNIKDLDVINNYFNKSELTALYKSDVRSMFLNIYMLKTAMWGLSIYENIHKNNNAKFYRNNYNLCLHLIYMSYDNIL